MGYELLWADEFESIGGEEPDPLFWGFELGDGTSYGIPGWGNEERQLYTKHSAGTDGSSLLRIRAQRVSVSPKEFAAGESEDLSCYYGPCAEWTSARLSTRDRVQFQFGRIEIRARFPFGRGTWPALWMLGGDIGQVGWPSCGEIDIAEGRGKDPYTVFGTIHGPGYCAEAGISSRIDLDNEVAADFHTFAIEWLPGSISWEVDSVKFGAVASGQVEQWVFDQPFYLLMNLAMGGNFAGEIAPHLSAASLHVDYVRHYSIDGVGAVNLASPITNV